MFNIHPNPISIYQKEQLEMTITKKLHLNKF